MAGVCYATHGGGRDLVQSQPGSRQANHGLARGRFVVIGLCSREARPVSRWPTGLEGIVGISPRRHRLAAGIVVRHVTPGSDATIRRTLAGKRCSKNRGEVTYDDGSRVALLYNPHHNPVVAFVHISQWTNRWRFATLKELVARVTRI